MARRPAMALRHVRQARRRGRSDGGAEVVCEVEHHPGGLGWLPDGRLLVVSMADRRVLRLEPEGLVEHADLSAVCPGNCNDMVVDARGNAYVGNTGYPYGYRGQPVPVRTATRLVLVTPDGEVRPQPGTLMMPNGCAITADGTTLVVAQSHAARLTAYDVAGDGSLHGERLFAALPAGRDNPDGICVDAEGAVWAADPHHRCCFRVLDGGQITHIVDTAPWECVGLHAGRRRPPHAVPRPRPAARSARPGALRHRRAARGAGGRARRGAAGRRPRRRLAVTVAARRTRRAGPRGRGRGSWRRSGS